MIKKILLLALLATSINSFSEVPRYSYISDRIEIPIRANKEFGNNILFSLSSGERIEVLEIHEDGWSKIKYGSTEGWMISRYIMNSVSSQERIEQLESENKLLNTRLKEFLK